MLGAMLSALLWSGGRRVFFCSSMAGALDAPCCERPHEHTSAARIEAARCSCCSKLDLARLPQAAARPDGELEAPVGSLPLVARSEARVAAARLGPKPLLPRALDPPSAKRQRAGLSVYLL